MLITNYKDLKESHMKLQAEHQAIVDELNSLKAKHTDLQLEFKNYQAAMALAGTDNTNASDAKRRINQIVREIDKCIALLNR